MDSWIAAARLDRYDTSSYARDPGWRDSGPGNKFHQRAYDHVAACVTDRRKTVTALAGQAHSPAAEMSGKNSRCDSRSRVFLRPASPRNSHEAEWRVRAVSAKDGIILPCTPRGRDHQAIGDKVGQPRLVFRDSRAPAA